MKHLGIALILLLGGCLAGCTTFTTKNQGEWSFFFGTQIGLKTTASQTAQEAATVSADTDALLDWLFKAKDGPPAPEPGPTN